MKKIETPENKGLLGFTLVELSIVLVIIGLIVGSILTAQDMIKAAEIRSTIAQYEKYNTAINTFRTKYNGIPGDLSFTQSAAFGIFSTGMTGAAGLGDGNGLLEGGAAAAAVNTGENLVFWRHLSDANMVDGSVGLGLITAGAPAADLTSATVSTYLPSAKIGRGNVWSASSNSGLNYYSLSSITAVTTAAGATTYGYGLTPIEAFNIDIKLDDGLPNAGISIARSSGTAAADMFTGASANSASGSSTPAVGECMTNTGTYSATSPTNTYSRGTVAGNAPACNLRMRFN